VKAAFGPIAISVTDLSERMRSLDKISLKCRVGAEMAVMTIFSHGRFENAMAPLTISGFAHPLLWVAT
jgi:hypothetical protein